LRRWDVRLVPIALLLAVVTRPAVNGGTYVGRRLTRAPAGGVGEALVKSRTLVAVRALLIGVAKRAFGAAVGEGQAWLEQALGVGWRDGVIDSGTVVVAGALVCIQAPAGATGHGATRRNAPAFVEPVILGEPAIVDVRRTAGGIIQAGSLPESLAAGGAAGPVGQGTITLLLETYATAAAGELARAGFWVAIAWARIRVGAVIIIVADEEGTSSNGSEHRDYRSGAKPGLHKGSPSEEGESLHHQQAIGHGMRCVRFWNSL